VTGLPRNSEYGCKQYDGAPCQGCMTASIS
jgi:hypothetical protein